MIRLQRKGVKAPGDWKTKVDKAFGAGAAKFRKKAKAFEQLPEQGAKRKAGFAAYAPGVLPLDKQGNPHFPPIWRHTKLKKGISGMSGGYCAYCQTPVSANHSGNEPGEVEHFRPKARFPAQAYDIRNYFLSCMGCNGTAHKGAKWPGGGYVRPDTGAPEKRFIFNEDGSVEARPRDLQARNTVQDFWTNRRGLDSLRKTLIAAQLKVVRNYLRANTRGLRIKPPLVVPFSPVSEAINQNVRRAWAKKQP